MERGLGQLLTIGAPGSTDPDVLLPSNDEAWRHNHDHGDHQERPPRGRAAPLPLQRRDTPFGLHPALEICGDVMAPLVEPWYLLG
jgi:hypothetical protein